MPTAKHTQGPCPAMSPRLPDDPRHPNGMLESDRDFVGHNRERLEWSEANARLIAACPDMYDALQRLLHPMADDSDIDHARALLARLEGGK